MFPKYVQGDSSQFAGESHSLLIFHWWITLLDWQTVMNHPVYVIIIVIMSKLLPINPCISNYFFFFLFTILKWTLLPFFLETPFPGFLVFLGVIS